ncbi:LPS assembly lipoprotein LptE [Epibacterium ulvae]|uniref:LPS-assembly lipoprotein n=1 Tax=Epibacterium ulvae TaxID=1156985 RepID=A0A1G5QWW6_9RHOB|nr:LPS assembly lipoprotein LptE [Epibacterium ulvae]SCZ66335.1 LPS-assembly lipoprotein [Epibacterium ulvae]
MLLLNRRKTLFAATALMFGAVGCGFTPVYAPGGTGEALFNQIEVVAPEKIKTRNTVAAFALVRALEERLGRGGSTYALDLTLSQRSEGQAITAENEITRFSIEGRSDYTLTRRSDGVIVASGTVNNFTGYSATGSTVETLAGERDAEQRLMVILADQIVTRLLSTDLTAAPTE